MDTRSNEVNGTGWDAGVTGATLALDDPSGASPTGDEAGYEPARPTRRRFLKWAGGLTVGASALMGRPVGFMPTAQAAPFSCAPFDALSAGGCLNCVGTCESFQSCCRYTIAGSLCCCNCFAGPFACNPSFFRAEVYCTVFEGLCCCGTCGG